MKIIPKCFYKYRKWKKKQKRILTHNEIYFASIDQFNDPFDCRIPIRLDKLSRNERLNWVFEMAKRELPDKDEDALWKAAKEVVESPEHKGENLLKKIRKSQNKFIEKNVGVFSMTTDCQNIIMWSHYADSHSGFCVGLSVLKLLDFCKNKQKKTGCKFDRMQVDYAYKYPFIDANLLRTGKALTQVLATKSKFWKYEREYRLLIHDVTRWPIKLPDGIITCVILGCESDDELRTDIISILRQKTIKPSLYKAKMKDLSFGLDFEEIKY